MNDGMNALLVASGDSPGEALLKSKAAKADILVAVDNGLAAFAGCGLTPDLIVGDMDSVSHELLGSYLGKSQFVTVPAEKNDTDATLGVDEAIGHGANKIVFLGATGGRIDHLLSNLMLLKYAYDRGAELTIEDERHEISLCKGTAEIDGEKGQTVSIIPMNSRAVVNAQGLYYPLEDLLLTNERPRGVSNVFVGERAQIVSDDFVFIIKIKE